jgi:hypothetical protein
MVRVKVLPFVRRKTIHISLIGEGAFRADLKFAMIGSSSSGGNLARNMAAGSESSCLPKSDIHLKLMGSADIMFPQTTRRQSLSCIPVTIPDLEKRHEKHSKD